MSKVDIDACARELYGTRPSHEQIEEIRESIAREQFSAAATPNSTLYRSLIPCKSTLRPLRCVRTLRSTMGRALERVVPRESLRVIELSEIFHERVHSNNLPGPIGG